MTVGELRRQLEEMPDDCRITFCEMLDSFRVIRRGPDWVDVEFHEPSHVMVGREVGVYVETNDILPLRRAK